MWERIITDTKIMRAITWNPMYPLTLEEETTFQLELH